jgi:ubiquinone/menaquinone biosynthesis C-methylase UbiE
MLEYCKRKSEEAGLENIVFCHGGFLTYEHEAAPVDAIVSAIALHHLPDFWKLIGLKRVARMLRRDGRFFLFDIVFPSAAENLESQIDSGGATGAGRF